MIMNNIIIGYEMIKDKNTKVLIECLNCHQRFEKVLNKNNLTIMKCKECGKKIVLVILEYNESNGVIIDYVLVSYNWYNKAIRNFRKNNKEMLNNLNNEEISQIEYRYILDMIRNNPKDCKIY